MDALELRIASGRQDTEGVAAALQHFATSHGASTSVIHDLQVAIDEVLSNIISHGYGEDANGEILVRLLRRPDAFIVEVEDKGRPFDPLQAPLPDLTAPLSHRRIGGLGVHFVRSLMDEVSYTRRGGRNCLRLLKHAPSA